MTSQVTVIKERARESLIAKGMLGEALNYWEAMALCHKGYQVKIKNPRQEADEFYLKAEKVGNRYAVWLCRNNSVIREYFTESHHMFVEWVIK